MVTSYGLLKGVSTQSTQPAPNNFVPIDPQSLYFETIFKDPSLGSFVTIQPSDCIHVVTTGNDPNDNYVFKTEDRGVQVDDVRAWTSLDGDAVYGRAPAGSRVVVTTGTSSSSTNLSSYLTPGSSLTYAEVNADLDGNFAATAFRTSTDATYKKVDLQQGSRASCA